MPPLNPDVPPDSAVAVAEQPAPPAVANNDIAAERVTPEILRELKAIRAILERPSVEDKLAMSAPELACCLSISERTLWTSVAKGTLPQPIKIESRSVWSVAAIERWLSLQAASAPRRRAR
jgi:predicted DNA-binding transcriptional regulator AlpA